MTNERTAPGPATARDREAGYSVCMFCEETGDFAGHAGHKYAWARWDEEAAYAFRCLEDAEGTAAAVARYPDTAARLGVEAQAAIDAEWAEGLLLGLPVGVEDFDTCDSCGTGDDVEDGLCPDCRDGGPEGPTCPICDGLGHGYPGGGPCPLEERGYWDAREDEDRGR